MGEVPGSKERRHGWVETGTKTKIQSLAMLCRKKGQDLKLWAECCSQNYPAKCSLPSCKHGFHLMLLQQARGDKLKLRTSRGLWSYCLEICIRIFSPDILVLYMGTKCWLIIQTFWCLSTAGICTEHCHKGPGKQGKPRRLLRKRRKWWSKALEAPLDKRESFRLVSFKIQLTHLFLYYWNSTGQVMIIPFPREEWSYLRPADSGQQPWDAKGWILVYWFIDSTSWQGWSHFELFIRTWPHVPGTDRGGMGTAQMWHCHCADGQGTVRASQLECVRKWGLHFSRYSLSSEVGETPTQRAASILALHLKCSSAWHS